MKHKFPKLNIGISSCLLGERVRFDGGHKRDSFLVDVFGKFVNWVPTCPEVEMGLGTPRNTLRLEEKNKKTHLVMPKTEQDFTSQMNKFSVLKSKELKGRNLSGYIFKNRSPSCGLRSVKVYKNKMPGRRSAGLFADAFTRAFPHLPAEDEGRLNDHRIRENFVTRVYAYGRWQDMVQNGLTKRALIQFHEQYKYHLMAHSQVGQKRMGKLVGSMTKKTKILKVTEAYVDDFFGTLSRVASVKGHANVLMHMMGYVSDHLDSFDRKELKEKIDAYRVGLLPLVVPITLLQHYVRKSEVPYLMNQYYLYPHPYEMALLNQI